MSEERWQKKSFILIERRKKTRARGLFYFMTNYIAFLRAQAHLPAAFYTRARTRPRRM